MQPQQSHPGNNILCQGLCIMGPFIPALGDRIHGLREWSDFHNEL